MKIAIDGRSITSTLDGIGRNVLNLLFGLSARESDLEFVVLYNDLRSKKLLAKKLVDRAAGPFRGRLQWVRCRSKPNSLTENIEIPLLLKMNKVDVFHDIATTGVKVGSTRKVVTVHELFAVLTDNQTEINRLKRIFRDADFIIAVSESVAETIENKFHISRPKIRVVANAIAPHFNELASEAEVKAMREHFKLNGNYLLVVSSTKASKNLEFILQVAQSYTGSEPLVITTVNAQPQQFRNVKFLAQVEDAWMRPLYAQASMVIVPSLYEGFSLPPLEALAQSTLPVVSRIAAHQELLGDILTEDYFFDPKNQAAVLKCIDQVLLHQDIQKKVILEKFRAKKEHYSYIETALQVQSVYREVRIK